jgi:hypothetical protein
MIISILKEKCEHIKEMSRYNNNYYRLPFFVNGCDVLYEHYNGAEDFKNNEIGNIVDNVFIPKYWLHENENDDYFIFGSDTIKDHNEWT